MSFIIFLGENVIYDFYIYNINNFLPLKNINKFLNYIFLLILCTQLTSYSIFHLLIKMFI